MTRTMALLAYVMVVIGCDGDLKEGSVISEEKIFDSSITIFEPDFKPLTDSDDNTLYLTKLGGLYQSKPVTQSSTPQLIYQFEDTVQGVIKLKSGTLLVSTDRHHKDASSPNVLWRSGDNGQSFHQVLTTTGGTIFAWSFAESTKGHVFAAEYGPQQKGFSKTLWRSSDDGNNWQAIFLAENIDGVHFHRIKADPYNNDIWLSQGDNDHAVLYRSQDYGANWQPIAKSQATDFVFTEEYLYLGEDSDRVGRIGRLNKLTLEYQPNWFRAIDHGTYSGSVYALAKTLDDRFLIMANMKYEHEDHIAGLLKIRLDDPNDISPLLHLHSSAGAGQGLAISVGPLCDGSIYWPGWRYSETTNTSACVSK